MDKKQACIELYKEAFGDEGQFMIDLFESNFNNCRYIIKDTQVAAMLFLLPCVLVTNGERISAYYLYAAATAEKHRKQGIMTRLLEEMLKEVSAPIFLKPANEKLIAFYEKRGFKTIDATRERPKENVIESEFTRFGGEARKDGSRYTLMYRWDKALKVTSIAFDSPMD